MVLKARAPFIKGQVPESRQVRTVGRPGLIEADDCVGIPHRDPGKPEDEPFDLEGDADRRLFAVSSIIHWHLASSQSRCAHIHRDLADLSIGPGFQQQFFNPGISVYEDLGIFDDTAIVNVLGNAADSVTAHLPPAAVCIVHFHAAVARRAVGRLDENETIGTDAEVPVRDFPGKLRGVFDGGFKSVDIDVIVADAVHLCEFHSHARHLSGKNPRSDYFLHLRGVVRIV